MDRRATPNLLAPHRATGCGVADTELILEVGEGFCTTYGEEVKFGGRQGDPRPRAWARHRHAPVAPSHG